MRVVAFLFLSSFLYSQPVAFKLLKKIPPDSHIVYCWETNPERAFLNSHLEHIWAKAHETKLGEGFVDLIQSLAGKDSKPGIQFGFSALSSILSKVDYGNLCSTGSIAISLSEKDPSFLCLLEPQNPAKGFKDLKELVKQVTFLLQDQFKIDEKSRSEFVFSTTESSGVYLNLRFVRSGPYISITVGKTIFSRVSSLIKDNGKDKGKNFGDSKKWRRISSFLPRAEDSVFFIDLGRLTNLIDTIINFRLLFLNGSNSKEQQVITKILVDGWRKLQLKKTFSFAAGTSWTTGRVLHSSTILGMSPGWKTTPIGKTLATTKTKTVPFDVIPGEAAAFSYQSSFDPSVLVETILSTLRENLGADSVNRVLLQLNQELGFDPLDLLTLFSGSQINYSVRSMKPQLFGAVDQSVVMIRLKDPKKASHVLKSIESLLIKSTSKQFQGMLSFSKDEDLPEFLTLKTVGIPMGSFAWGIKDGTFYFTSDIEVLKQSFKEENRGDVPFYWRDDFCRLGIFPTGPVYSFSYMDLGRVINNSAQALNMFGIMAAFLPNDIPDAYKIKKVFGFLPRLSVILRSLDFLGGIVSITGFDKENGFFITHEAIEIPDTRPGVESEKKPAIIPAGQKKPKKDIPQKKKEIRKF